MVRFRRAKMKKWLPVIVLYSLSSFIALLCYNARGKTYVYLFGSIHSRWYDAKLAKITEEGEKMCPTNNRGFCKTPCWNGTPYQEPEFLITPNCTEYSARQALLYVYSTLENFHRRQKIRLLFKRGVQKESSLTFSLVFVVGVPTNMALEESTAAIKKEQKLYGDMMQITIPDTYTNLGYKGLAVFKWVQQCGEMTQFLSKLDDNTPVIIDMDLVFWGLRTMKEKAHMVQKSLVCMWPLYDYHAYEQKFKLKWDNSFTQYYPTKFPIFCQGKEGMFMTRQAAFSLYKAARGVPMYHTDDAYIAGMLRERACLEIINWGSLRRLAFGLFHKTMHTYVELFAHDLVLSQDFQYLCLLLWGHPPGGCGPNSI